MSDYYYELCCLWPTWRTLVHLLTTTDPESACPQSLYGAACGQDRDRLAARLYGEHTADSMEEGYEFLEAVLEMARDGFRPRSWREAGFADLLEEL